MLISVIVPVYNVENYLRECLDSILAQTYRKLEVILVDDGSKDSSGTICDEYKNKYDNFYVIHKKNEGLGKARNSALDIAHGDYVYFLDSDDYIEADEIEYLYKNIEEFGVEACYVGYKAIDDKKNIIRERKYKNEVFLNDEARHKLLPRMLGSSENSYDSIEMSASGQLYSMVPIRKYKLRFCSERELISEDLVFNIDYLQYANGACTASGTGNYYRMNPNSLSHSYLDNRFEKSRYFYIKMQEKITSLGYDDDAMKRLTKSFFINIKTSMKQEVSEKSPNCLIEKIRILKAICSDDIVHTAMINYPCSKLGIKQRTFLFMIRYKMAILIYYLLKGGL